MIRRHAAAARAVQVDRGVQRLGERGERRGRVVPPDRAARDDRRPLGALQDLQRAFDLRGVARHTGARAVSGRQLALIVVDAVREDIPGALEEHRTGPAREHGSEGLGEERRHAVGRRNPIAPLGDAGEEIDLLHLLERALAGVEAGRRASEEQHRARRRVGIRDAGDRVGDAGPRGDAGDPDAAGEARRRVGCVRCRLLVACVDDGDALFDAGCVDGRDVEAGEREDVPDTFGLEHAREQLRAGGRSHACLPSAKTCSPAPSAHEDRSALTPAGA